MRTTLEGQSPVHPAEACAAGRSPRISWILKAWRRCPRVLGTRLEGVVPGHARKNGVRLCGNASGQGISGATVGQGCIGTRAGNPIQGRFHFDHWTPSPCLKKSSSEASCLVRTYVCARFSRMNPRTGFPGKVVTLRQRRIKVTGSVPRQPRVAYSHRQMASASGNSLSRYQRDGLQAGSQNVVVMSL